jgi:ubiquinone/menaquinone biosynthesis C-methylase UbiE
MVVPMARPDREYGQQDEMEHPTMVGTLRAQIEMIWPLERPLLERLGLPGAGSVVDLGAGTCEASGRIARTWPALRVTAVDLFEGHLALGRREHPPAQVPNLATLVSDARRLPVEDGSFGAAISRHVTHALPDPERLVAEAYRVLRAGGLLYLLAEDYAGVLFETDDREARDLYLDAAPGMLRHGTDLLHGRRAYGLLRAAGFQDVRVDPIVLDPTTCSRETFARMLRFWRDGYVGILGESLGVPPEEVGRRFDGQISAVLDPGRWFGWWLLAVSGRKPR